MKIRNISRILSFILVLALILSGCGEKAEPQQGSVTAPEAPAEQEAPIGQKTPAAPETPAEAPAEEDANPLALGRMEGGTYTNTYAGFACDLDQSWTFYSAEELQTIPDGVKNAVEGSELGELMGDMEQLTDMMAENVDLMATVNVLYSKQDMSTRLAYQALSDEEILDATLAQSDMMKEAYTQAGIEVSAMEKVQVPFLGKDAWAIKTTAETEGVAYYILQVFNFRAGAYSVTLTCSSFVEDQTQTVLDLFYEAN